MTEVAVIGKAMTVTAPENSEAVIPMSTVNPKAQCTYDDSISPRKTMFSQICVYHRSFFELELIVGVEILVDGF